MRKLGPKRETRLNPEGEAHYQELYNLLEGRPELLAQWITEDRDKREGYRNHSGRPPQLRSLLLRRALELGLAQLHAGLLTESPPTDDPEDLSSSEGEDIEESEEWLVDEVLWSEEIKEEIKETAAKILTYLENYEEEKKDFRWKQRKRLYRCYQTGGYKGEPTEEVILYASKVKGLISALRKHVSQLKAYLMELEESYRAEKLSPEIDFEVMRERADQFSLDRKKLSTNIYWFEIEWGKALLVRSEHVLV